MVGNNALSVTVTAAEISRSFGEWQHKAMTTPVTITHHGRARLVLASVEAYASRTDHEASDAGPDYRVISSQLRVVLSQMHEAFIALDKRLKVVDLNAAAEAYFGLVKDEACGRHLGDISGDRNPVACDFFRLVIRTGETIDFKMKAVLREDIWFKVHAFPYSGGAGAILTNLTTIEEARLWHARSDAMMLVLKEEPAMAGLILNARAAILWVDPNFCLLTGFDQDQLSNLMLTDIIHPSDSRRFTRIVNTVFRDRKTATITVRFIVREGAERRLRLHLNVVGNGEPLEEVVVLAVDAAAVMNGDAVAGQSA